MPDDAVFTAHRTKIAELTLKNRLPFICSTREFVNAGGLMSYGPDTTDLYRRAADYIDKIFRGTQPANLPVQQPTKFELTINLSTAKALGLDVPPMLLARADQVIEYCSSLALLRRFPSAAQLLPVLQPLGNSRAQSRAPAGHRMQRRRWAA